MAWGFSTFFTGTGSMKGKGELKEAFCICNLHCQLIWHESYHGGSKEIQYMYGAECKLLIKVESSTVMVCVMVTRKHLVENNYKQDFKLHHDYYNL